MDFEFEREAVEESLKKGTLFATPLVAAVTVYSVYASPCVNVL